MFAQRREEKPPRWSARQGSRELWSPPIFTRIASPQCAHSVNVSKSRGVNFVELDATRELPFRAAFQRILVDAPCSGTGTLSRHPEIRWRLRPEQLAEFHRLQVAILINAIALLAPQGRIVYSTCSLEPEENEDVVAEALQKSAPLLLRRVIRTPPRMR